MPNNQTKSERWTSKFTAVRRALPRTFGFWLVLGLLLSHTCATQAEAVQTTHTRVELITEQATLPADGGYVNVGFHIEPNPGWHVYWMNPGDAGLPATMQWSLPEGFSASEFEFPAPHVIPFGNLVTYGFDEPVLLLSEVSVPSDLSVGETATLSGSARWVVCDDELCVPDRASLSLTLPVGDGADNPNQVSRFAAARAKVPKPVTWPLRFEWVESPALAAGDTTSTATPGDDQSEALRTPRAGETSQSVFGVAREDQAPQLRITVATPRPAVDLKAPYLFVATRHLVEYGWQQVAADQDNLVFSMDAGNRADATDGFQAVMTYTDDAGASQSVQLNAERPIGTRSPSQSTTRHVATAISPQPNSLAASANLGSSPTPPPDTGMSLATALLFALIGGVILNLMPCVFPVLSIKALSLVATARTDRRLVQQSGLLYTVGILVAFTVIGVALISLRAAGQAVGWGFQLQSPLVNLGLAALMLAIGLNLLGVFEIGARAAGAGQSLTLGDERKSAFFTGLLAVVVATPCTAPFMAGALGYALMQPAPAALGIFLALGFGLAFPYLLVSFVPSFGRLLPKPGAWMARFRNILAFPMFATALWLLWILGKQLGVDSMTVGLLSTLLLGLALWAYGQIPHSGRPWAWGCFAAAALIATITTGASIERYKALPVVSETNTIGTLGQLELERFTPDRLADYVAAGLPTFTYFTADWCVNCKLNERVALASDAVGRAFRERGIKVLVGDWTNEDPVISEWLNRYGRAGVPLYLYFPPGSNLGEATILPQVLLPERVIDAINRADGDKGNR